jgi:hypothetical protein
MQGEGEKQSDSRSRSERVGGKNLRTQGEKYPVGDCTVGQVVVGGGGTISLQKTVGYGIRQCSVDIFLLELYV